jgi:hypothetical protein
LVGSVLAWQFALPALGTAAGLANRLGLVSIALGWTLAWLWNATVAVSVALARAPTSSLTIYVTACCVALWLLVARPWASHRATT